MIRNLIKKYSCLDEWTKHESNNDLFQLKDESEVSNNYEGRKEKYQEIKKNSIGNS